MKKRASVKALSCGFSVWPAVAFFLLCGIGPAAPLGSTLPWSKMVCSLPGKSYNKPWPQARYKLRVILCIDHSFFMTARDLCAPLLLEDRRYAMEKAGLKFDEVGPWSEMKLEIIEDYAKEYSKIISAQKLQLHHLYIDAFAGAGVHKSKSTGALIPGSPEKALSVIPPFKEYHLIDLDAGKVDNLKSMYGARQNVFIHTGDCNTILLEEIFPRARYDQFKRGLCLLDPYGLDLNWEVIQTAGKMRSLEIFLNFPMVDMNRNVFWHNPAGVRDSDIARMTAYWGDESWRDAAYTTKNDLFGKEEKVINRIIAEKFRDRLIKVAGFDYVSRPLAMRNSNNSTLYYLFFASQKPVAKKIIDYIFDKYAQRA